MQVLGNQVGLVDQATIDVSSNVGGGTALIGGNYQGQGNLPTAQQTRVESGVQILADALEVGDGGTGYCVGGWRNRICGSDCRSGAVHRVVMAVL